MMSLTFGLFTQVSGSGPLGPLVLGATVLLCNCPVELPLYLEGNNLRPSHIGNGIKEH